MNTPEAGKMPYSQMVEESREFVSAFKTAAVSPEVAKKLSTFENQLESLFQAASRGGSHPHLSQTLQLINQQVSQIAKW